MSFKQLPEWFRAFTQIALLGEISPHVRLIAASISNDGVCVMKYYFDQEPTEDDIEHAAIVSTNIAAMITTELTKLSEECIYATGPQSELNRLDGAVYSRLEGSDE